MDFRLTGEQRAMQAEARRFLADNYPPGRVAELSDSELGWDPRSWTRFAAMGWLGIDIPTSLGGAGLGFVEVSVLLEQLGYAIFPGPYFAGVVLARPALADDELVHLADGSVRWSAEIDSMVPDLALVDRVVTDRGAVPAVGETLDTTDRTRRLGRLAGGLEAGPSGSVDLVRVHAGVAAEAVGVAQRALDIAVVHARERAQFGRAIGGFQAVSHPLADCYVKIELARCLAHWAAWSIDHEPGRAAPAAAAAKAHATETASQVCERAIQVLGGLGFTWEHLLHRAYKRALALMALTGSPRTQRRLVAAHVIDDRVRSGTRSD